jgi:glycosyltransferase involved in cell wall biosynthesis
MKRSSSAFTDKTDLPLVSIIIPTYNRADLLRLTLESVVKQTYPNLEIILIDDGSTDHTAQVARTFQGKVQYIYQENQGTDAAIRNAFRISQGKYVSFLDHDDLIMPSKIMKQVELLESNPNFDLCHCGHFYINGEGNWIQNYCLLPEDNILKELVMADFVWSGAALVKRDVILDVGLHDEAIWCSDWDLWLRIASRGYHFAVIQQPLGAYRILPNSQMANVEGLAEGMQMTLDKFFSDPNLPKEMLDIKHEAYSRSYFETSCGYYRLNSGEEGKRFFARSIDMMSQSQRDPQSLANMLSVASFGFRIQDPLAFIEFVFAHLPENLPVDVKELYKHVMVLVNLGSTLRFFSQGLEEESRIAFERVMTFYADSQVGEEEMVEFANRAILSLPLHDPVQFLQKWLDLLPKNFVLTPSMQHRMMGRVCMDDALLQYHAEKFARAWKSAFLSCIYLPGNLGNKGILSILVKSPFKLWAFPDKTSEGIPFRSVWENRNNLQS